ncbi:MAG: hypothetical protein J1F12_03470 [Muribaculaceae bacterium]|nr:hypothetical protein [Muribaculaceae bacterium]
MKVVNFYLKTFFFILAISLPALAFGVTQKEMEQARTIAAKAYLRYANDGSGYLDDLNPKTMEDLEASLKPKEKENLKAFKAIAVPKDYKDWNKEKLVEYWAVTAFQDKGLLEKGRGGRIRARSQINKMTIAPPQSEQPSAPSVPAANPGENKEAAPASQAAPSPSQELQDMKDQEAKILADEEAEIADANIDKATNYTWVYIMVLAILVAIVVALVVYAANVMKKNGQENGRHYPSEEDSENADRIEHLEGLLTDKDVEIAMLNKKIESLNRQNSELKSKLEEITSEKALPKIAVNPSQGHSVVRSIFLGRANMKGIFVRADRTLNVGNSVFVLETTDGFSGSFKVADSPAAWSLALSNPREYLENACVGRDLEDTNGASKIITETSGTAVFEGGCWRVIRKAKIRYQ